MTYLNDPSKLSNVFRTLAGYEDVVTDVFRAGLKSRIMMLSSAEDRLVKLFILANADRQGTGKGNVNLVTAAATFQEDLEGVKDGCRVLPAETAHQHFLGFLCDIQGMDQKTANLFLKYSVMFQSELDLGSILDWSTWKPFLHVPLDMWVLRLMGKDYLGVCQDSFENDFRDRGKSKYVSPSFKSPTYTAIQADIRTVASSVGQAPIILDMLWFVGHNYCYYHPLMCDICWLSKHCVNVASGFDLTKAATARKSANMKRRKTGEKGARKAITELFLIWQESNPGTTRSDFYSFTMTPEGEKWLTERIRGFHRE